MLKPQCTQKGHTLKNSSSKITGSLQLMPTKRRILVTGTPIQNNLEEFFVLVDIVNPGLLGSLASFKTIYEKPILVSKEKSCSDLKRIEGELRAQEVFTLSRFSLSRFLHSFPLLSTDRSPLFLLCLWQLSRKTSNFILRRQADILQQYLPPKSLHSSLSSSLSFPCQRQRD